MSRKTKQPPAAAPAAGQAAEVAPGFTIVRAEDVNPALVSGKPNGPEAAAAVPTPEAPPAAPAPAPQTAPPADTGDRFERVRVAALYESPTNPRKSFDPKSMEELIDSVRERGILVPLTLRENPLVNTELLYEIIAGTRRYRAAKAVGLPTVPAVIKELSDADALEIQLIDNVMREDITALDEAEAYRKLIDELGYTAERLHQRIGKSVAHVYARLKLTALGEAARAAMNVGSLPAPRPDADPTPFTAGHAILLARLQPDRQELALEQLRQGWVRSVRELKRWIEQNVHLDLSGAAFALDDAELLPEAGACTVCPKRLGSGPDEAVTADSKTCLDPTCYKRKNEAYLGRALAEAETAGTPLVQISTTYAAPPKPEILSRSKYLVIGEKGRASCKSAQPAIIADGDGFGKRLTVCADQTCTVHFATSRTSVFRATAGAATAKTVQLDPKLEAARKKKEAEETKRLEAERRAAALREQKHQEFEKQLLARIVVTVQAKLARRDLDLVFGAFLDAASYNAREALYKAHSVGSAAQFRDSIAKLPELQLNQMLVELALRSRDNLTITIEVAKARKIDPEAIRAKVNAELDRKAAPPKKPVAKAAANKPKNRAAGRR